MGTSDLNAALIEANTRLREQVAALSERLREILAAPSDPLALAKARYVLAKVDQLIENARSKSELFRGQSAPSQAISSAAQTGVGVNRQSADALNGKRLSG